MSQPESKCYIVNVTLQWGTGTGVSVTCIATFRRVVADKENFGILLHAVISMLENLCSQPLPDLFTIIVDNLSIFEKHCYEIQGHQSDLIH